MAENKKYNKFGSLQLNADDIMKWNEELPENAFEPASSEEKENFIQDRKSVLLEGCMETSSKEYRCHGSSWDYYFADNICICRTDDCAVYLQAADPWI